MKQQCALPDNKFSVFTSFHSMFLYMYVSLEFPRWRWHFYKIDVNIFSRLISLLRLLVVSLLLTITGAFIGRKFKILRHI